MAEIVNLIFEGSSRGALAAARQTKEGLAGVGREAKTVSSEMAHAERNIGRATRGALAGSGAFRGMGRSIAFASATFLGTAGFISVVGKSITNADHLTRELERSEAVFGSHARAVKAWSKTTAASLGLPREQSLKLANDFGVLLERFGLGEARSAAMAKQAIVLASALNTVKGADPTEFINAFGAALVGRTTGLRQYDIVITKAMISQEALRLGFVKSAADATKVKLAQDAVAIAHARAAKALADYGANSTQAHAANDSLVRSEQALARARAGVVPQLTAQQRALVISNLVMQQSQGTLKKASDESDSFRNELSRVKAELSDLETEAGQVFLPTLTKLLGHWADWLSKSENQQKVLGEVRGAVDAAKTAINDAWPVIKTMAHWADEAAQAVGGWKNAIKLLLALAFVSKLGKWTTAITGRGGLLPALKLLAANWEITLTLVGLAAVIVGLEKVGQKIRDTGFRLPGTTASTAEMTYKQAITAGPGSSISLTASGPMLVYVGGKGGRAIWVDPSESKNPWYRGDSTGNPEIGGLTAGDAADLLGVSKEQLKKMTAVALGKYKVIRAEDRAAASRAKAAGASPSGVAAPPGGGFTAASGGASAIQQSIIGTAQTQLGIPYRYGGPPVLNVSTDCSGLVKAVLEKSGITGVPRTAAEQYAAAPIKNPKPLLPGDLVFYDAPHIGHVGIYVGNGTMIVDPHTGGHVQYESITGPGKVVATARWWDKAKSPSGGTTSKKTGGTTTPPTDVTGTGALTVGEKTKPSAKPLYVGAAELETQLVEAATDPAKHLALLRQKLARLAAARKSAHGARLLEIRKTFAETKADIADEAKTIREETAKATAEANKALAQGRAHGALVHRAADIEAMTGTDVGAQEYARLFGRPDEALRKIIEQGRKYVAAIKQARAQAQSELTALAGLPGDVTVILRDSFGNITGAQTVAQLQAASQKIFDSLKAGISKPKLKAALTNLDRLGGLVTAAVDAAAQEVSPRSLLAALDGLADDVTIEVKDQFGRVIGQQTIAELRALIQKWAAVLADPGASAQLKASAAQGLAGIVPAVQQAVDAAEQAAQASWQRVHDAAVDAAQAQVDAAQGVVDSAQQVVEKAQQAVDAARSAFEGAIDRAFNLGLQVFDARTQQLLQNLRVHVHAAVGGIMAEFDIGVGEQTPAERALATLQRQQQVTSLQDALAQAQASGDPKQIAAAQLAIQEDALSEQAKLERDAADKALAEGQKNLEQQRAVLRDNLQLREQDIVKSFEAGKINAEQAQRAILALLTSYGAGYQAAGQLLGAEFAGELHDAFGIATTDAGVYAQAVDQLTQATSGLIAAQAALAAMLAALNGLRADTWEIHHVITTSSTDFATPSGGDLSGTSGFTQTLAQEYQARLAAYQATGQWTAGLQHGGKVPGNYIGREDTVLARLTPGETVIDRKLTQALEQMIGGGFGNGVTILLADNTFLGSDREVAQQLAAKVNPEIKRIIGYPSPMGA